jgi:isopentenyl-diphosphate delta-isomerase
MGMSQNDKVVLVDEGGRDLHNDDGTLSTLDKIEAHRQGSLHRAVSVFIFNHNNELLLQKRAAEKYHSAGKWSNTCCTHPFPGQTPIFAARRRLIEEMGILTALEEQFTFKYKAEVGNSLIEHEFDHVFTGAFSKDPVPNAAEVSGWKWMDLDKLGLEMVKNPEIYTPWLRLVFRDLVNRSLRFART